MHYLQKQIISKLILSPALKYSQLKPEATESNLFSYHLNQLIKDNLVVKAEDGYELTGEGKVYADQFSLETFKPRLQPRIVTLITCQNFKGEWLLHKRTRQPLINQIGFPYGKIHTGESIAQAANRELLEKTGLKVELEHRGDGYVTIHEGAEVVSQVLFHLFYGQNPTGKLGNAFWSKIEDIAPSQLIVSTPDLIRLLHENPSERFFAELVYTKHLKSNLI